MSQRLQSSRSALAQLAFAAAGFLATESVGAGAGLAASEPAAAGGPTIEADALDYETLSQVLAIESLRAGSHAGKEPQDYVFEVSMFGLLSTPEERQMEFARRKQLREVLGRFGGTHMEPLAIWRPDEKLKDYKEFKIAGRAIRELVARAMQEFSVKEAEIMVRVEVAMLRRIKRYLVLGDDARVAAVTYDPIPATKFDVPMRTNQPLAISDERGTVVKLALRYETPAVRPKAASDASAKTPAAKTP